MFCVGQEVQVVALRTLGMLGEVSCSIQQEAESPRRHIVIQVAEIVEASCHLNQLGFGLHDHRIDHRIGCLRSCGKGQEWLHRMRLRVQLLRRSRCAPSYRAHADAVDRNGLTQRGQIYPVLQVRALAAIKCGKRMKLHL